MKLEISVSIRFSAMTDDANNDLFGLRIREVKNTIVTDPHAVAVAIF